jgi:hypothetical protein
VYLNTIYSDISTPNDTFQNVMGDKLGNAIIS